MTERLRFTNAAFVRSHGRNPRGRGTWAFQQTTRREAFDADLFGETFWGPATATLTEAQRALREAGATGTWAVLP